jgi:N6-adenosine-specific RNA methylase IME4
VMEAWGFAYKTNAIWEKDKEFGTGFYYRMQHEHLMLARLRGFAGFSVRHPLPINELAGKVCTTAGGE